MNVFYNRDGIGDTLIISMKEIEKGNLTYEKKSNVVRLFDEETSETVGYNIFSISESMQITDNGQVKLTEELLQSINNVIKNAGYTEEISADFSPKFVVGYVEEKTEHPNADKLSVCKVDVGEERLQIVCGAANVAEGQKVVVAKVGAIMPSGLVIKEAELRGIASSGMICSAKELDLQTDKPQQGILVLSEDYEIGAEFPLQ